MGNTDMGKTDMGKTEYLDALKRAMAGLPSEAQAKTLAYYEQRFVDACASGRSEQELAAELDDPKKIAMTLRASTHLHHLENKKNPGSVARTVATALGLAIFNLFMVVPALVCALLLASLYVTGTAMYGAGVIVTASGLSGANEIALDGPWREHLFGHHGRHGDDASDNMQAKVFISEQGIRLYEEPAPEVKAPKVLQAIERAEAVAERGVRFSGSLDEQSRVTQSLTGLGILLGGIGLLLLSLVVTKYSFIAAKRYVQMNYSLLKGS
jgi:uncharacterized membrane protein